MKTSAITIVIGALIALIGVGGLAKATRVSRIHAPFAISMIDFSDMAKDIEESDRLSSEGESHNLQFFQANKGKT